MQEHRDIWNIVFSFIPQEKHCFELLEWRKICRLFKVIIEDNHLPEWIRYRIQEMYQLLKFPLLKTMEPIEKNKPTCESTGKPCVRRFDRIHYIESISPLYMSSNSSWDKNNIYIFNKETRKIREIKLNWQSHVFLHLHSVHPHLPDLVVFSFFDYEHHGIYIASINDLLSKDDHGYLRESETFERYNTGDIFVSYGYEIKYGLSLLAIDKDRLYCHYKDFVFEMDRCKKGNTVSIEPESSKILIKGVLKNQCTILFIYSIPYCFYWNEKGEIYYFNCRNNEDDYDARNVAIQLPVFPDVIASSGLASAVSIVKLSCQLFIIYDNVKNTRVYSVDVPSKPKRMDYLLFGNTREITENPLDYSFYLGTRQHVWDYFDLNNGWGEKRTIFYNLNEKKIEKYNKKTRYIGNGKWVVEGGGNGDNGYFDLFDLSS